MERSKGVPLFIGQFPSLDRVGLSKGKKELCITISNMSRDRPIIYILLVTSSDVDYKAIRYMSDLEDKSGTLMSQISTMDIWIESVDKEILMPDSGELVKGWGIDDEDVLV